MELCIDCHRPALPYSEYCSQCGGELDLDETRAGIEAWQKELRSEAEAK